VHGSGGEIFSTKHATCSKARQKIVVLNQHVMDFVGDDDAEKGVKKAAGRYADATNASNIVGFTL
jgi:hypothetical protein